MPQGQLYTFPKLHYYHPRNVELLILGYVRVGPIYSIQIPLLNLLISQAPFFQFPKFFLPKPKYRL